jgi:hypothetical protein
MSENSLFYTPPISLLNNKSTTETGSINGLNCQIPLFYKAASYPSTPALPPYKKIQSKFKKNRCKLKLKHLFTERFLEIPFSEIPFEFCPPCFQVSNEMIFAPWPTKTAF